MPSRCSVDHADGASARGEKLGFSDYLGKKIDYVKFLRACGRTPPLACIEFLEAVVDTPQLNMKRSIFVLGSGSPSHHHGSWHQNKGTTCDLFIHTKWHILNPDFGYKDFGDVAESSAKSQMFFVS
jgi:hypothetical protein